MKFILPLLLTTIVSCSLSQRSLDISSEDEGYKKLPGWVNDPYEECMEVREFCAVGEGSSSSIADAQARANLASIFEVRVESEFGSQSQASQSFPWQGAVKQEVLQSLKESVKEVLETVQIKKKFRQDRLNFSLAGLNRGKVSELVGERIQKIDQELDVLWAKKSRINLRKIMRLYLEREKLNERYSIVSGQGKRAPVTFKEIIDWRLSRPLKEPLSLEIKKGAGDWISDKVVELLTEAGFKIVTGEAEKKVILKVESTKEFLNVKGFEKYTFTLSLTSFDKGEKNKMISTSETVTGRNQEDALLKVKSYFDQYLENHLSDLHLD